MWDSLKNLLKGDEKVVIVEDGEPKYVLVPASEYKKMSFENESKYEDEKTENGIPLDLSEIEANEEFSSLADNNDEDVVEVRLEDLDA